MPAKQPTRDVARAQSHAPDRPAPESLAPRLAYLAALFLASWAASLMFGLWIGHERFGALALAGTFGGAVAPWCAGALIVFLWGRRGRPAALITSVASVAVLAFAQTL